MKIIHLPSDCGNHGPILSRAERRLGHQSDCHALNQSYLGYKVDKVYGKGRGKMELIKTELIHRWRLLWAAIRRYDVIHFNYGSNILPTPVAVGAGLHGSLLRKLYNYYAAAWNIWLWDLWLLKKLGKVIVVVFQGGDARQGDVLQREYGWSDADEEPPGYYTKISNVLKRWRIRQWDRYADHIYYINPDHGRVLPARAKFLPYMICDYREIEVKPMRKNRTRLVFGHIVNHREPKGTRFVLEAMDALRKEGHNFGFLFAERLEHATALELYRKVDVMVEQFVIGYYGAQAVECMAMGIPVMVWIRPEDRQFIPLEMQDFPFIQADRFTLKDKIREVIRMPDGELDEIARKSRAYVEKHYNVDEIAMRLIRDYQGALGVKKGG